MKYKVGDKVKITGENSEEIYTISKTDYWGHHGHIMYLVENGGWYFKEELEPVDQHKTDAEVMREIIEGRNSEPKWPVTADEAARNLHYNLTGKELPDPIQPQHYNKGEIDLYEAWSKMYPMNEFRAGMEMIAMRYMFRDKEDRVQDLDKAIYTLQRLKEYEENAK